MPVMSHQSLRRMLLLGAMLLIPAGAAAVSLAADVPPALPLSPYEPPAAVPGMGINLDPPAPGIEPLITAEQAISISRDEFASQVVEASAVSTAFGLFTDSDYGPDNGAAGTASPYYTQVPAWIVTFENAFIPVYGGSLPGREAPPLHLSSPISHGQLNVVIHAETGEYLEAFAPGS